MLTTIIGILFACLVGVAAIGTLANSRGNLDETQGVDEHDDNITD